jgi:hypothetical protein
MEYLNILFEPSKKSSRSSDVKDLDKNSLLSYPSGSKRKIKWKNLFFIFVFWKNEDDSIPDIDPGSAVGEGNTILRRLSPHNKHQRHASFNCITNFK